MVQPDGKGEKGFSGGENSNVDKASIVVSKRGVWRRKSGIGGPHSNLC